MKRMVEDSIDDQVAVILRDLEELKTRQFTSQNSGMKFKQIDPVSGNINLVASTGFGGEVFMVKNKFVPTTDRPVLMVPSIKFDSTGLRFEYYRNYSIGYESIAIYTTAGAYLGYMDVWQFQHLTNNSDGYEWQTTIYTWANAARNIPFTIELRASDEGKHTLSIDRRVL